MSYEESLENVSCVVSASDKADVQVVQAGRERPIWLSAEEAEVLLRMCSLSPVSAGDVEEILFRKMGKLIGSFETPHPKAL